MTTVFKPIILDSDGVFGQLADGSIVNIGGTSNATFTVGGRGLLFDDGSSTGGPGAGVTLQSVYDATPAVLGSAAITLAAGKDFAIFDNDNSSIFFKINADTGKVTISGDLEVIGASTIIETTVTTSDHWLISPKLASTSPLRIEPVAGVTPIVDLVSIRRTFASTPVFRIDSAGNLIATQNLTISGLINGIDIVQVASDLDAHLSGTAGWRHLAADIDILPIATLPGATNVQEALEELNIKVDLGGGGGGGGGSAVRGYEHVQSTASVTWTIPHGLLSRRAQLTVYDNQWEQIIPEKIKIIDANTAQVTFTSAISGRVMVLAF